MGHTLARRCFRRKSAFSRTSSSFQSSWPASWPRPRFVSDYVNRIHNDLQHFKEDKWGWVIYRTTYQDDAAWEKLKGYVQQWSRETLAEDDVSSAVLSAMDWTFVSDRATLDGASRQQLRHRFREWRRTARHTENPRRDPATPDHFPSQRYLYFVQVDEESLQSVLEGNGDFLYPGWVHLVRCYEEMDYDQPAVEEDDGWMMITASMVRPEFYDAVGSSIEYWDSFYQPPPDVVEW